MTHWNDMINRTAVLTLESTDFDNQGIYSASYVGDSPLQGAWMRLIVRGLIINEINHHRNSAYVLEINKMGETTDIFGLFLIIN